jgi:threonyl-tRNA synthetase
MKDHKQIGVEQELYYFDELSPGCCFFLPHGTRIHKRLREYLEKEYWHRGFQEVITPRIAKNELWMISGHWEKYKDDMFGVINNKGKMIDADDPNVQNDDAHGYSMCPMQCPMHCLMFRSRVRSYRELPLRLADFGMLHRNEDTGALRGLFRTRCFQQDDAHIFCRRNQIRDEIRNSLGFLEAVYGKVKLDFSLELSTRPEKFIGSLEIWNDAESQLEAMLNEYSEKSGRKWNLMQGEGAFYGPKIDVHVRDSLGRSHQCATIQLDFNLPSSERFNLRYINEAGDLEEPVIIHRAIFGSFGRFMGILTEHFQGRWPFWLSPRQVKVIPISEKFVPYAQQVADIIHKEGFYVDVDSSDNTMQYKIAVAQTDMCNYMVVVGQREMDKGTVNVRYRDVPDKKEVKLDELIVELNSLQ